MSEVLVVDDVSKAYPRFAAGARTLQGMLARRVPALGRDRDSRWGLQGVSFAMGEGETVGLVGRNGAGKSTLLRLVAGLGRPTHGTIRSVPDVSAILSLGSTFDLTLSGRENATVAGVVGGLSAAQARAQLDAVLAFAELEQFGDAPVRTYSEGMKLRLAFGVVAQLQPSLLLFDEVLSVGDLRFQARCLDWMAEQTKRGASVLYASHDLDQMAAACDRVIWLEGGQVRAFGPARQVVDQYRNAILQASLDRTPQASPDAANALEMRRERFGSQEVTIEEVTVTADDAVAPGSVPFGAPVTVSGRLRRHAADADDAIVVVSIVRRADGVKCVDLNTAADAVRLPGGSHRFSLRLERLDLEPGQYAVEVGAYRSDWEYAYDHHVQAYPLLVTGTGAAEGVLLPPHRWVISEG